MRNTTVLEKLLPSVVNAVVAIASSLPVLYFVGFGTEWKISTIIIFYLMQVVDTHKQFNFRCFGMRIVGTVWGKQYSKVQRSVYSVCYTLSFSTLFLHVFFLFDIFLFNIFLIQLPFILLSGTTFHGFLAGGVSSKMRV